MPCGSWSRCPGVSGWERSPCFGAWLEGPDVLSGRVVCGCVVARTAGLGWFSGGAAVLGNAYTVTRFRYVRYVSNGIISIGFDSSASSASSASSVSSSAYPASTSSASQYSVLRAYPEHRLPHGGRGSGNSLAF